MPAWLNEFMCAFFFLLPRLCVRRLSRWRHVCAPPQYKFFRFEFACQYYCCFWNYNRIVGVAAVAVAVHYWGCSLFDITDVYRTIIIIILMIFTFAADNEILMCWLDPGPYKSMVDKMTVITPLRNTLALCNEQRNYTPLSVCCYAKWIFFPLSIIQLNDDDTVFTSIL